MTDQTIIGLGEILWDMLPDGKTLGGAPCNFAYDVHALGHQGIPLSRIGEDRLGDEIISSVGDLGMDAAQLQRDSEHPTGTVQVELDETGTPDFTIVEEVAWDYMEPDERWLDLARRADAICFGTLAQRANRSRRTIQEVLRATEGALVVYDVNIRQDFYSREVFTESLAFADILKLNDQEIPVLQSALRPDGDGAEDVFLRRLIMDYGLKMVCVTLGAQGCRLVTRERTVEKPVPPTKVGDTVGSGDPFTAGMVVKYLQGASPEAVAEAANLVGAYVAGRRGATPDLGDDLQIGRAHV